MTPNLCEDPNIDTSDPKLFLMSDSPPAGPLASPRVSAEPAQSFLSPLRSRPMQQQQQQQRSWRLPLWQPSAGRRSDGQKAPGENGGEEADEPSAQLDTLSTLDTGSRRIRFTDMHDFTVEVSMEAARTLRQVERRCREQGRVWWSYEANKGPLWFEEEAAVPATLTGAHIRANLSAAVGLPAGPPATVSPVLKRLIRKGVPPHLRAKVWQAVSGAARKRANSPEDYYLALVEETGRKETDATRQIQHDLHRTCPGHPFVDTPQGLAALRNVLVAYSFRDSHVGYCQGMNYVAAHLLLVMRNEEDAFWMLATLVEQVLYDDCFAEDLFGCHVEQRVLTDILRRKLPRLWAHLEEMGFELSLVATEWFLCVFAKSFPSETTLRVWDVLFSEGAKVLFRVALAIFKMHEAELLTAKHVGEAVATLVRATSEQFDPDALLSVAFDRLGSMPMAAISRQRRKQKSSVAADLEQRQHRIAAYVEAHGSAAGQLGGSSRAQPRNIPASASEGVGGDLSGRSDSGRSLRLRLLTRNASAASLDEEEGEEDLLESPAAEGGEGEGAGVPESMPLTRRGLREGSALRGSGAGREEDLPAQPAPRAAELQQDGAALERTSSL